MPFYFEYLLTDLTDMDQSRLEQVGFHTISSSASDTVYLVLQVQSPFHSGAAVALADRHCGLPYNQMIQTGQGDVLDGDGPVPEAVQEHERTQPAQGGAAHLRQVPQATRYEQTTFDV